MGYRNTLEVELRIHEVVSYHGMKHVNFTNVLPKFKEKGVVAVVDVGHGDQIIYSSRQSSSGDSPVIT